MDFKQLEVFVRLAENKSFSATANELKISQPTVSLHIKQLEEELDAPLFVRSTRELKITLTGEKLYRQVKELLEKKESIVKSFSNKRKKEMILGVSTISANYIMPPLIKKFNEEFPDIYINISEKNSAETIKKVSDYKVDIGIVGMKIQDENCEFYPIYKDEFVFIAPNTDYYRKLKESNPSLKELVKEPFILREDGSGVKRNTELIFQSQNVNPATINTVASVNGVEVMKQLVARGVGTSLISKIAVEAWVKRGELLEIEIKENPHQYRQLYLVWNKKITLPTYVQEFLKIAKRGDVWGKSK